MDFLYDCFFGGDQKREVQKKVLSNGDGFGSVAQDKKKPANCTLREMQPDRFFMLNRASRRGFTEITNIKPRSLCG